MFRLIQLLAGSALALAGLGSAYGEPLQPGATLPNVSAANQDGTVVKLADLRQEPYLLVYFYPKADTPGCTAQACSLRDAYTELTDDGVTVIGVSLDSVTAQKRFQEKYHLPFTLLADEKGDVARAFGVPVTAGFAKRQAYLFATGELVWRDTSASTKQQADDVKAILAQRASGQKTPAP